MQIAEGKLGRVFVLRLEDGDAVPDCLEEFARAKGLTMGSVLLIGGIGGGQVVSGPRDSVRLPPEPMLLPIDGAHEIVGVGLIAPDKDGIPRMHMHAALGRAGQTKAGCVRPGIIAWHVGEVVIYEILDVVAARLPDIATGFELLQVGSWHG
ncbi:MAG: DNA-binding protein [Dehalococcoidia bacterium]|nr:DNA-binding protein [Dehalococcoidia bacterium]